MDLMYDLLDIRSTKIYFLDIQTLTDFELKCFCWIPSLPSTAVSSCSHFAHSKNLYQKKKTINSTDRPAPIATHDVAFSDVASLRKWADCAAKLLDLDSSSEIRKVIKVPSILSKQGK